MKCIVSGGCGFLGSHVAAYLRAEGHAVTVIDDLSGGFLDNLPDGCVFRQINVCDVSAVNDLFAVGRFDAVFHLAAYAAEGLSHHIRRFNYTNNSIGSATIINACVNYGVRCVVFASSIAIYGSMPPPFTEAMTPHPEDPYGIAKYAVELDLAAARRLWGLNYVIFRPHNVIGPRQNLADPFRNVAAIFIRQCLRGEPMTIFGDGTQRRAFSYVGDVAPIIAEAAETPGAFGQTFNIGADEAITVNELAEMVAEAMGVPLRVEHLPPRPETHTAFSDHAFVRQIFGTRPTTPLHDGIAAMATWAKKVGVPPSKPVAPIEVRRGLPPSWGI